MKNLGYTNHSDHAADAMRYAFLSMPRKRRQSHLLRNIILGILFAIAAIALYIITKPANDAYNKHMCAVYGYYEDCKTPLPEELRLK